MKILIIDGMNFAWRSKVWGQDSSVGYVFFRNLRSLIDQHKPQKVYYVLEGHPKFRYELLSEYKANRILKDDDPKSIERKNFLHEIKIARKLMAENLPIITVRHPDWECDDVIYNLVKDHDLLGDEIIVSSSDTDFIQILQKFSSNVKLWNHTKKSYVEAPEYDYITWKSLRGDGSDNIKGIRGIGDKRATDLAKDAEKLRNFLSSDDSKMKVFTTNFDLIKFHDFSEEEKKCIMIGFGNMNEGVLKDWFESIDAQSMLVNSYWEKFCKTFRQLSC